LKSYLKSKSGMLVQSWIIVIEAIFSYQIKMRSVENCIQWFEFSTSGFWYILGGDIQSFCILTDLSFGGKIADFG